MSQIAWSPFPGHSSRASPSHTEGLDLTGRDEWRAWMVPTKAKSCSTRGRCGHSQEEKGDPRQAESRLSEDKQEKEGEYGGRPSGLVGRLLLSRPPMMRRSRPFFSRARQRPPHTLGRPATVCLWLL